MTEEILGVLMCLLCFAQICMTSAKTLSHMINARHWTIITDPELSLLKVSQLERIRFHEQPAKEERKGGRSSKAASCMGLLLTGSTKASHRLLLLVAIGPYFVAASIGSLLFGRFHLPSPLMMLLYSAAHIRRP